MKHVKAIVALLLCALMLMGTVGLSAMADTTQYVRATGNVNLRSGPGTNYWIMGSMQEGISLPYAGYSSIDQNGDTWYRVDYQGQYLWVSANYSVLEDGNNLLLRPFIEATARVNVRSGPGTNYEDIGTLVNGERVEYLDEIRYDRYGNIWYKIQYYSFSEGWVSGMYSQIVYAYEAGVPETYEPTAGSYVKATYGKSNLRTGPGLNYRDIDTVENGEIATYLNRYSTDERGVLWYYVRFDGQTGWLSSRYTTLY